MTRTQITALKALARGESLDHVCGRPTMRALVQLGFARWRRPAAIDERLAWIIQGRYEIEITEDGRAAARL